jgi:acetyl-CoA acetyltransferase
MPTPVYIAGAALTRFGRLEGSLLDLLVEASAGALEDAGARRVDTIYLGVMNPEEFTGEGNLAAALADRLELPGAASSRVETASSTGAGALESAFFAVASGYREQVLVVAGETMTGLSTRQATRILAEVIAPSERRYGASMPSLAALVAGAYADHHRLEPGELKDALARVALKNHSRGALNPFAQFQKPISEEKYLSARPVADPLGLYDCAPITDGAAALVLSRRKGKVRLAGMGHATDSAALCRRGSLVSFNSTRRAALQAYAMAQVNPSEVDFAEVHDAFTMFEIIGSEDLGFYPPGEGWVAAADGRTGAEGELPINPSGGLKSRGHPVGASGLAQVVEAHWLLTGQVEPGRRLAKPPRIGLTQSIGGLGNNNLVTVLVPADRPLYPMGPWQSSFTPSLSPARPAPPELLPARTAGRVLAATRLHTPPEGFPAPLDLVMAETREGWATLSHWQGSEPPALDHALSLELVEGLYHSRPAKDPTRLLRRAGRRLVRMAGSWRGSPAT